MIKRILFDLDNTLIPWDGSQVDALLKTFQECGISFKKEDKDLYFHAMHDYESKNKRFDKVDLTRWIAKQLDLDLPDDFVKRWTDKLCYCVPEKDSKLIELLDYLSNKYSLCIVSNWFYNQQKARLKNYDILKYFDEIYTCDKYDKKPYKEMYEVACQNYEKSEVVMVGDDFKIDIKSANDFGLYAYYLNKTARYCNKKTKVIREIYNLKDYL